MNKIEHAIDTFYFVEKSAHKRTALSRLHPLSKVLVSIGYILFVISFPKYNLFALLPMCSYFLLLFTLFELSFKQCLSQIKYFLLLVCIMSLFNPIFDRTVLLTYGPFSLTTGILSMITLILKGLFTVIASYLLIVTTTIEEICYALKRLHIPDLIISILLLSYRYLLLLLFELHQMNEAYQLRAVHQNGLHIKTWGSFIGSFLLRSIDRADDIAQSMTLRGFNGTLVVTPTHSPLFLNIGYVLFWFLAFTIIRFIL